MKVILDLSNEKVFEELIESYCREKGWNEIHYNYDVKVTDGKKFVGEIEITINKKEEI
ncbi:hypothetical protein [Cetobacterium sp.]|uniref:hypothetical protein n=1 Tax=Cetobacterium sp. TaxID=2071632 RepID=UPI003F3BC3A9